MARDPFRKDPEPDPWAGMALAVEPVTEAVHAFAPPVEILESDDEVMIRMSLPGVEADDVRVFAAEDEVDVEGVVRPSGFGHVRANELRYGEFRRRIRLPFRVEAERGVVVLRGGLLRISLPRLRYHS